MTIAVITIAIFLMVTVATLAALPSDFLNPARRQRRRALEHYRPRLARRKGKEVLQPSTVVKITPSGLIDLTVGCNPEVKRFKQDGCLMGGSRYYEYRIDHMTFEARAEEQARFHRSITASRLINEVKVETCHGTYGKEAMQQCIAELQTKLDAAKAAVEAI